MKLPLWPWLKRCLHRFREDDDLLEELQSHLDQDTEERLALGASPAEAKRQAHLQMGSTLVLRERMRDAEWFTVLESWVQDLVFAMRSLLKAPVFFGTAVLTLGLGMGASTIVFSFLYGLVLRPLPTVEPSRLVQLGLASYADPTALHNPYLTWPMLQDVRSELRSYEDVSAWDRSDVRLENTDGTVSQLPACLVSDAGFTVIPVRPYLGRVLLPFDDQPGGGAEGWATVLSYDVWNTRFGSDSAILGKRLRIAGALSVVVGVMPPSFKGLWPGWDTKLYLPLHFLDVLTPQASFESPDTFSLLTIVGRLKQATSIGSAQAELARFNPLLSSRIPERIREKPRFRSMQTRVASIRSGIPNYVTMVYAKPLGLMQGLVGLVLLLCCTNVAGLMLTKVQARRREFAVRRALGAPTARIMRQLLVESFIVSLAGSCLGAFLTWYGWSSFLPFLRDPMMGESLQVQPDSNLFWITGALAVCATFVFGLLPAWRAGRSDPGALLTTRGTLGGKGQRTGRLLVPLQTALSFALVVLAVSLGHSMQRLRTEHTGFDTDHVTIQTSPLYLIPTHGAAKMDLYWRILDRLRQMPGVRGASVVSRTPLTGEAVNGTFAALGEQARSLNPATLAFNDVGPEYFRTMVVPVLAGREFTRDERSLQVCVLNQSAAKLLFRNGRALGQSVRLIDKEQFPENSTCRVIGIAADAKFSDVRKGPPPTIYFPVSLERFDPHIGGLVFLINSAQKLAAINAFQQALREIAPTVPLNVFVTLREQLDAALGSEEMLTVLSLFFGGVSLFLSALGLYALLSTDVLQRRAEIGVRLALGGTPHAVLRMILREGTAMVGWGVVAGTGVLLLVMRFLRAMLHGVSAWNPSLFLAVIAVLGVVALAAGFLPAWRASRIDPMVALRNH